MFEKCLKLLENSYSPYSHFRVSSIVVMKDGKEFYGVNIENASYGATICAERVAIFNAIASGYKPFDFEKIYVLCDSPDIQPSCFICRQVMSEMFESDKEVIWYSNTGKEKKLLIKDICPYPFVDACMK
ncbi:cytidine deaminase [Floccifex sp.]|uniref:cytidine deaminase n=1 Tax=Floccifex sp. TaxID=2815810 RepID=UPI003F050A8D